LLERSGERLFGSYTENKKYLAQMTRQSDASGAREPHYNIKQFLVDLLRIVGL
jgi:hypothetical protein